MRVCLLTSDARHSAAGERIAALADCLDGATIATTGTADWPGATHVDELSGSFDAAAAFGWQACLHVFRVDAKAHAYVVPALEEARLWHGDERRLLAALTYDLPLTLIAPSRAVAKALEDRAPGRSIVVVEPGVPRKSEAAASAAPAASASGAPTASAPPAASASGAPAASAAPAASPSAASAASASAPLRVASAAPAEAIFARVSEPIEAAAPGSADVLLELVAADAPLLHAPRAMLAGVVPVVTPVEGHDELIADGESGLVAGFDDVPGAARLLDTLARDRELLARLRQGALSRAESLPTVEDEAAALRGALEDPAPAGDWPARLLLNARAAAEPVAQERRALDQVLRDQEQQIAELTAENERMSAELAGQARAYKVGKKLEPVWGPLARRRDTT